MVIDLDRCSGCRGCVVACKQENNIAPSTQNEADSSRMISWMNVITVVDGDYPDTKLRLLPMLCQQCDNPPCVRVCPVGATQKSSQGIVGQIYPRCIGCRYCASACPYQVKYFNWFPPSWPKEFKQSLNPDVSVRPKGVIEKCTFCVQRLQRARDQAAFEGRKVRSEGEYVPACVESCPAKAMYFGDLEDRSTEVAHLARDSRAFRVMDELGTAPSVIYLKEST
jgi:molybdopterin-containing oxidoreductase family iron-sulfur binding subunit